MLGVAGGFALGIFVYPYVFLADIVASDKVPEKQPGQAERRTVARGTFVHANPSDPIHYGKGRVTVYEGLLHLEPDFEVGPGPKFHVYLVPEKEVVPSTNVAPTLQTPVVSDNTIDEGGSVSFTADFSDPGFDNPDNPAGEVADFVRGWPGKAA